MTKKSLKPALRFKNFTEAWEQCELGDISKIYRGLTFSPNNLSNKGIRILRSSNIDEGRFIVFENDIRIKKEFVNVVFANNKDILVTAANGSPNLVGKHAIITNIKNNSAVAGGFMLLIRSNSSLFINHALSTFAFSDFLKTNVLGGNGAIGNLSKSILEKFNIFAPINNEQQKIASFLDNIDNLITLHQRKQKITKLNLIMIS
ncbi:restriction endonuclease subunit S [Mycoplasma struthionis]|uniref:Type I restriction modification DNA specificity domain-containing protein n=1 Tax=Mycoplasma struthionis TaxID=538220 RepID=A0A3G8LJX1_9MOLU|nr:restriction endonuclease subunit S [Mycoplasma struthionis]AZG68938.1 hypothetical protein EGN60_03240 [Mycoplasma struthionis]